MLKVGATSRTSILAAIRFLGSDGEVKSHEIKLYGLLRTQPDWDALFARHKVEVRPSGSAANSGAADVQATVTDIYRGNAALYSEVFDGWDGVADAEGKPLPYSQDAVRILLESEHGPAANRAFQLALHELRFGALEKN